MRWLLALAALVALAAPALAWQMMPTLGAMDDRVETIDIPTDRPHVSLHHWDARFELAGPGLAYALTASLPIEIAGRAGAEPAPLQLVLDVRVNGAPAAHEEHLAATPEPARLSWPVALDHPALRSGENEISFDLRLISAGGSLMPGWWSVEAGPAGARVGPR